MSVEFYLLNGKGGKYKAQVYSDLSLSVTSSSEPAIVPQKKKIFRQFLTADGTSTGSNDMLVDGSVTNVDFWIPAAADCDRYITVLSYVLADGGLFRLNEFGNTGSILTNGCRLFYTSLQGEVDIHNSLQSNFDFVRLGLGNPAYGQGSNTFRGTNFIATAEAIMPVVDLKEFMPPFGIKLDAGSTQKIVMRIRDNASVPDVFNCIAYGFDRFV